MTKKSLNDLTILDLQNFPLWEFWSEDNIEYVKPSSETEIYETSKSSYVVLTEFTINNQLKYYGYCSPQDPSGLDYIQPVMFVDFSQIELWKENGWSKEERDQIFSKLKLERNDFFPITFTTRIKCDGEYYTNVITDFNEI